jgi:tetratricopeptide (TPR) repeat protein
MTKPIIQFIRWRFINILIAVAFVWACTTLPPIQPIRDLNSIAGKWEGIWYSSLGIDPMSLTIRQDGTYEGIVPPGSNLAIKFGTHFVGTGKLSKGTYRFKSQKTGMTGVYTLHEGGGRRVLVSVSDDGRARGEFEPDQKGFLQDLHKRALAAIGSGSSVPSERVSTAKMDTSQNMPVSMPKDPIVEGKVSENIKTTESAINHLIEQGKQADKAGRMDEAIELFTAALRLKPQSVEAVNIYTMTLLEKGKEAGKAGEMDTAIRVFTNIMRVAPSNPSAYYHRGIAFFSKEQFKEAIQDFTEAIRLDSVDDLAYIERGACYYQLDNFQQAIEDFTTAISLKPDNPRAYRNRGSSLFGKGDYESAIRDYDTAISLDPKSALAYLNRAEAYRKVGRLADVVGDYDKAMEIRPDDPEILYKRGLAYWRLEKKNMALTDLRRAANLGFKDARDFLAKQNIRDQ